MRAAEARRLAWGAALMLLTGCAAHRPASSPQDLAPGSPLALEPDRSPLGSRVVAHAEAMSAAGLPGQVRHDCSGFVVAAFAAAGRPLEIPVRYQHFQSLARMLHVWSAAEGRTFRDSPRPGDLAFFRDTVGALKGQVTHLALVERVGSDGTVELIHYLDGKVRHDRMSLSRPTDPSVNVYLRRKKHAGDPVLAGQLFVAYARFDEVGPTSTGTAPSVARGGYQAASR